MKKLAILLIMPLLFGCSSYFNVERRIILPDKSIYTLDMRTDDLVTFEKDGVKFTVDGRGRPGMIEQALGIMFMNLPDVEIAK